MKYEVSELMLSIQGEGSRVGCASIFVRLVGCNLSCSWCDEGIRSGELMSVGEIVGRCNVFRGRGGCDWVVLTGGEPTQWELEPLVSRLRECGYRVGIESNGTGWRDGYDVLFDHVTVSPKRASVVKKEYGWSADEFKYVIEGPSSFPFLEHSMGVVGVRLETPVYLQPEWSNWRENALLCAEYIGQHARFRLSMQMHKIVGVS